MKKQNVMGASQIKLLCAFCAACTFAFPSLTLAEVGLVAAYTFNEGSGTTVADVSGNNNTGTLGSGVTWSPQGKFGNALAFNGASLVTVPHSSSLDLTAGATLEAWVFPTAASSASRKVLWKDWPEQQWSIFSLGFGASSNSPEVSFTIWGIPVAMGGPANLPVNVWSHLAATYDAATSTMSLYVDGVLRSSLVTAFNPTTPITTSTGALRIGGNTISSNAFFQGRIDEVRIYNRALSQGEIQSDMNTPVAPPTPDTTLPTATTGLTATAVSTSQINLAWSAATDNVGVTGYRVERCQGVGCTTFAQTATPSGTSFSDSGLTPATGYSYRVRAADAAGNLGAYSNIASATPPASDTTPPTAPSGLTATAVSSSQINLNWTASTDNLGVTGYRVESCQGASCSNFAQIAAPNQTSYSDTLLTAATSYSYRVRAVDAAGNLGAYSVVSATTQAADTTPPTAPSGLTATAANGQRIDLSWTASTDNVGVDLYFVERCQGANCTNFAQIQYSVPTSFNDYGVSAGKTYRYRVRARDLSGNLGAYSNIASATTPTDKTPPTAPSGLIATPVSSSQINLSWTASTDNLGVDLYEWYRCQGASCTNFVIGSNPSVTYAADTGLAAATTYRYKVRAKDVAGNASAYSNIVSATTQAADTTPPTAPSGLTASVTSSQVNLSWTISTDNLGVTAYRVERCQGAGCTTYAQVGTSTIVSFSDTGLATATSYSYRVRAADAAGNLSPYSNTTSVTTQAADTTAPTAPTGLTATAASASQINLTWTASTDDVGVTGYQVDRCQGAGCSTFDQVATPTGTSFNDAGLTPSTSYSYRVRATDAAGNMSANSGIATATTQAPPDTTAPTAPTGLTATTVSTTQINLTWTASSDNVGVTGYRVERCQGTGCANFVEIAAPTATSFSNTGLTAATSYSYRVRATDAAGNLSGYSNVANATTGTGQVQAYYIHSDHLNTPRLIADASGATVWRWDQGEPFGNDVPNNDPSGLGGFDFPLRFPGQYFDRETNLAYNVMRDFDPAIGRYVESDPIGLLGGLNTYAYVSGQPLVFIDPNGLERYGRPKYNSKDPDRTAPLPLDMERKVTCLELCMNLDLIVTGGAEQGRHDCADSRHYSGNAVDFGFNSNPRIKQRSNDFFCCALKCGFDFGWPEGGTYPHYHLQTIPGCGVPRIPGGSCSCK